MWISVNEHGFRTEAFDAGTSLVPAVVVSVVSFGVWMLGVGIGDVHTGVKAIHAIGALIALAGAVGTLSCAWLSARVWVVRHRR